MISKTSKTYCCEDISKIENYDEAIADKTQMWHCHHRAEILPCGRYTVDQLRKYGLYWHRPACELIFLRHDEHRILHRKGMKMCQDTRRKMSESHKGKPFSEERRRKMSEAHKGNTHSCDSETRRKISKSQPAKITVEMTRLSDDFTMRFHSHREAARYLRENGFPRACHCNISVCCRGIRAYAYGAKWRNVDV